MEWLERSLDPLAEIGLAGSLDIAIVTVVIYTFLIALRRTRRSAMILTGVAIMGAVFLLARRFNLVLTTALLQGFFAVILVALVVIFQEDLRYFFERVALWWVERRVPLYRRKSQRLARREVEVLARTLADLARARIGALVVIRGRDVINRHIEGGEEVQGILSEPLIKSIFDPHSLGHDGAVIIEGNRVEKLGVHLPLSKNLEKLPRSGTRHAAALGLSERTDALCLVVSEERGRISAARRGDIKIVTDSAELADILENFYREISPIGGEARPWHSVFHENLREKVTSFVLAVLLWTVVVQRSQIVKREFSVPVTYSQLPADLVVTELWPSNVIATFSGPRRAFLFVREDDFRLVLKLWRAQPGGLRTYPLASSDLVHPPDLSLEDIEPRQIQMNIEERNPSTQPAL
jgi:diadenylate cyclase